MTTWDGLRIGLLAALLGFVVAGCGGTEAQTTPSSASCAASGKTCISVGLGRPIYLGTLLYVEDPIGDDVAQSVRIAVDYLDGTFDGIPGQLLGHDIAILNEDEGCSSVGGRTGATRLAQERDLLAVIGTSCSSAAFGAADVVLAKQNVLLISPSNTAPGLTASATHQRNYFRIAFNDVLQASAVADFAYSRQGWKSAVAIHRKDDAYSSQLTLAFSQSLGVLGGTSLADLSYDKEPAASMAASVARQNPDMVFIAEYSPRCEELVAALRNLPATRTTPIVVSEACQTPDFFGLLGSKANGIYAAGPDFSVVRESAFYRDAYLPTYRRLTGGDPIGVFHPAAWDAVNLLFDAVRRTAVVDPSGGLSIDREALRRALLAVQGYDGLSGRITCESSGDCAESARIAIYRAPNWPVVRGDSAKPVFSQLKTLAEVMNGG